MNLLRLSFSVIIAAVMLQGCVSLIPPSDSASSFYFLPWQQRQKNLKKIKRFTAIGVFSLVQGRRSPILADYEWTQWGVFNYRIRVFLPLNLLSVYILGDRHSVALWNTKKWVTALTPEALIKAQVGWHLPVRYLLNWIRGVAGPTLKKAQIDRYGHLKSFTQNGWCVCYSHYTNVRNYDLPQRIVLLGPSLRLTLVVKRWKLNA